jgi:glycosyltransferase involved in cell wall biosynthesis
MRIVIDLQGAQSESRLRGIGRYTLGLAEAMIRNGPEHEFIIALNGMFPDSIESLRAQFADLVHQGNIRVWSAAPGVSALEASHTWRRQAAELAREAFLISLDADVVHVTSLFDGFYDEAVHSVGLLPSNHATAVTFYDVIPLIESDVYLKPNPAYESVYREKIEHLKRADLLLAISESSRQEAISYLKTPPPQAVNIGAAADAHFRAINVSKTEEADLRRRCGLHKPFVMYSGATDERKNHRRLIKAFSLLPGSVRDRVQLAIVGRIPAPNRDAFVAHARSCGLRADELVITGGVSDIELLQLYNLCELFVFPSWHEGFGLPALEAMACGAAVIGSNTTSLPEVIGRADALFDPFDESSIAAKIREVLEDEPFRQSLRHHAERQAQKFSWDKSAMDALAAFAQWRNTGQGGPAPRNRNGAPAAAELVPQLVRSIAALADPSNSQDEWANVARAIAQNHPRVTRRQFYVDVSELVLRDSRSGIQRVVRSVLAQLLAHPPEGFTVEPVFALPGATGYRYARSFRHRFLGLPPPRETDDVIEPRNGDLFLGLDLQHGVVTEQGPYLRSLRNLGVEVFFVIYDLIPILAPWAYPEDADLSGWHSRWLDVLQEQTGVICISRAVADEFEAWLGAFGTERVRPLRIGWFHLGADVAKSVPSRGLGPDTPAVLAELSKRPTFLSVGTLEPRKGHVQTLAAFELLWKRNENVNLVFVGRRGWNSARWRIDRLIDALRSHPEFGRRLFWLESISDEYLEAVYKEADCLIAASQAEGFGLPLIEAALHGLPIIARDIPVFREVAKDHAFYFDGLTPDALADRIGEWLKRHSAGNAPGSGGLSWLTWEQSTAEFLQVMLKDGWYRRWMPPEGTRIRASDPRIATEVGILEGHEMRSSGEKAGWLMYGAYLVVEAGEYRVILRGRVFGLKQGGARVEVATDRGLALLGKAPIIEPGPSFRSEMASLTISVPRRGEIEVRVWVEASTRIAVSLVDVSPLGLPASP